MSPVARSAALIGAGVGVAAAGYWAWQQLFSRDAQIEAVHRACIAEFAQAAARMKSGVPGESSTGIAKGINEGVGRMIDGMSGSMSDAVCATLRDTCRDDFDGQICAAARERYL